MKRFLGYTAIALVGLLGGGAAAAVATAGAPGVFNVPGFAITDADMQARTCGTPRTYTVEVMRKNGIVVDSHEYPVSNCQDDGSGGGTTQQDSDTPPAGAFIVTDYGADPADSGSDTQAFKDAMTAATAAGTASAPAVLWVPDGVWRVYNVAFKDNVRMEATPGATIEEDGSNAGPLFTMDNGLTNVAFVGTDPESPFTLNLDPAATGASINVKGIDVKDVDGFEIGNVHIIENRSATDGGTPDNQHAAFVYRHMAAGEGPSNGDMHDVSNETAPRGYGPTQITGGDHLSFEDVSSDGGTAVRLETDGNGVPGVHNVTIDGATCTNGNSALTLIPHGNPSSDVTATNVSANSCDDGFRLREPTSLSGTIFVDNATVLSGPNAMISLGPPGSAWELGNSENCYINEGPASFVGTVTCTGF